MDDFPRAAAAASAFDSRIKEAGTAVSEDYANLLALAVRQALASIEITISQDGSGSETFNTSDVKAFLKDMGGIGSGG